MRRWPNPWISLPALFMGLLAGALGWMVTDVGCDPSCPGLATLWAVVAFLVVTISVALVLVLVYRSLAEWREKNP